MMLGKPLRLRSGPRRVSAVTILVGAKDTPALEPSRALAAALPRAQFVVVSDAGHVLNLAVPALFNEHLLALLRAGRSGAR